MQAMYERHNLKVHPYGDVMVDTCTECGAIVFDQSLHNLFHRQLDADQS